tara:strand:- start:331 stop:2070 length:1740 start_codon:yes stop_codon:yes gene_type:complete
MGVLNDNIVAGSAGASTGQEIYAPSTSDWDYTFSQDEWAFAGNTLGNDTIGGATRSVNGGDSGIYSLHTFDGDLAISFTIDTITSSTLTFGLSAVDEDNDRAINQTVGMTSMTNSFWYQDGGGSLHRFMVGNSAEGSTVSFSDDDEVLIERSSGTITVKQNGSVVHTYGTTYTNPLRFCIGQANVAETIVKNILYTDSEGIQRDGFINEGLGTPRGWGGGLTETHFAFGWKPTRTMTVTSTIVDVQSLGTSFNAKARLYTDNAGSPGSLISASNTVNIASAGNKTFTFTSGDINRGTWYWMVFSDEDAGSGSGGLETIGNYGSLFRSGKSGTITNIVDHASHGDLKCEIIGETTEEPTPDWDTLLLIHSNTSDASTTFVDSSPYGHTISANGSAQHDTAQKKFGTSSMLFDGNGDYLSISDHSVFDLSQYKGITIDCWLKTNGSITSKGILHQGEGDPVTNFDWYINGSGKFQAITVGNGSAGSVHPTSTTSINDSAWHHLAMIAVGGKLYVAVDGTFEHNESYTNNVGGNVSTDLRIGKARSPGTGDEFTIDGWIDEVRISSVARWESNFTPPTSPYP